MFTEAELPVQPPRGQVRMRLVGPTHWTDLSGPVVCELLTEVEMVAVRARLGSDPLRREADPDRAWTRISRSRAPLATLLMDQSVLLGCDTLPGPHMIRTKCAFMPLIALYCPSRWVSHCW